MKKNSVKISKTNRRFSLIILASLVVVALSLPGEVIDILTCSPKSKPV